MEPTRKYFLIIIAVVVFVCLLTVQNLSSISSAFVETVRYTGLNVGGRKSDAETASSRFPAYNSDLQVQKSVYQRQADKRYRAVMYNDGQMVNFLFGWVPQISCPTMVRVGSAVDGGKWMCNPWRLASPNTNCTVYSLGVGNDVSFELEMNQITNQTCQYVVFDPEPSYRSLVAQVPRSTFVAKAVRSDLTKLKVPYLFDYALRQGHDVIHVLKIDIEGDEFNLLPALLKWDGLVNMSIGQIALEIHHNNPSRPFEKHSVAEYRNMLTLLENNDFLLFSKEPNHWAEQALSQEFSFIHKNWLEFFGLSPQAIFNRKNSARSWKLVKSSQENLDLIEE